ncbi:MAG: ATP-binding cassette domain-containing protein [Streptosporangiales bacterium]|nr:ATP-binding cassette domain-containing protein [Streptosporangiales bacterium]
MMTNASPALELTDIRKSYGGYPAVKGVGLRIARGGVSGIIGPNGAGKTTLFGVICGDLVADSGSVWLGGVDVTRRPASARVRQGLGRTFQTARVFERLTVSDNALIAVRSASGHAARWFDRPQSSARLRASVHEALAVVDLVDLRDRAAGSLGQGERKRLEIALALALHPKVLLLDEPTAGMSLDDVRSFVALIRRIVSDDHRMTVLLTAHDMDVVFGLADRIALMAGGEIVLEGTPEEIRGSDVAHEVYLGRPPAPPQGGEGR